MTALVDEHPSLGVECVLRELHIASSTYYRWRRAEREPCEHRRRDSELTEQIKEIHADSGGIYGSPRVHAVLKREGVHVGRKRVERLMREADIAGVSPRRTGFTRRDPKATLAPDLVQRDFTASAPNRLWVTDLTMIATGEGPLWLSAIRDAPSSAGTSDQCCASVNDRGQGADLVEEELLLLRRVCDAVQGPAWHRGDDDGPQRAVGGHEGGSGCSEAGDPAAVRVHLALVEPRVLVDLDVPDPLLYSVGPPYPAAGAAPGGVRPGGDAPHRLLGELPYFLGQEVRVRGRGRAHAHPVSE
ncbi:MULTISPECIES: IS3 family transposase [unclassified Streptomyces]|uniref:IS3 family transposase n=1 Tax=unclassified Streptomyces TaxID=2593676 RepID=UPI002F915983